MRSPLLALAGGVLVLGIAACGQANGPEAIADGSYAVLNSSLGGAAASGQAKVATLGITGPELTLTQGTTRTKATIGEAAEAGVLCPSEGKGEPRRLSGPLTVGQLTLSAPAVFGPCPGVSPSRVTVVDLDSVDASQVPFSYTRWVAFCDTGDSDC